MHLGTPGPLQLLSCRGSSGASQPCSDGEMLWSLNARTTSMGLDKVQGHLILHAPYVTMPQGNLAVWQCDVTDAFCHLLDRAYAMQLLYDIDPALACSQTTWLCWTSTAYVQRPDGAWESCVLAVSSEVPQGDGLSTALCCACLGRAARAAQAQWAQTHQD